MAVPAAVPGLPGRARPSPAGPVCPVSCLSQPGGFALLLPLSFLLRFRVRTGQRPQGVPLWPGAPAPGRNCEATGAGRPLPAAQPGPERAQIPPKAPNLTWLSPRLLPLRALLSHLIPCVPSSGPCWVQGPLGSPLPPPDLVFQGVRGLLCPSPCCWHRAVAVLPLPHAPSSLASLAAPGGAVSVCCLSLPGGAGVQDPTRGRPLSPCGTHVIHQVWLRFHHPTLQEVSWLAPPCALSNNKAG